jgi:hypothetical protein
MNNTPDCTALPAETLEQRIAKALAIAVAYGGIDGAHHKDWTIDQMVRALTGCPVVEGTATDHKGQPYQYRDQGESDEYRQLVAAACAGEDGPDTYSWETGIAP